MEQKLTFSTTFCLIVYFVYPFSCGYNDKQFLARLEATQHYTKPGVAKLFFLEAAILCQMEIFNSEMHLNSLAYKQLYYSGASGMTVLVG